MTEVFHNVGRKVKPVIYLDCHLESARWRLHKHSTWLDLIQLSSDENQAVTDDFTNWVESLSVKNGASCRGWWYTWLSSRDQVNCELLAWWRELFCLEKLLNQKLREHCESGLVSVELDVNLSSFEILKAANLLALNCGWRVRLESQFPIVQVRVNLKYLKTALYQWKILGIYIIRCYLLGLKKIKNRQHLDDVKVILVTIFHASQKKVGHQDAYFGKMLKSLKGQGVNFAVTGLCYPSDKFLSGKATIYNGALIHPFGCYLNFLEILLVLLKTGFISFSIKWIEPHYLGLPYRKEALNVLTYGASLMGEATLKKLIKRYPKASFIQVFENNPWERAISFALHQHPIEVGRAGFYHCAVIPFHLKNRFSKYEVEQRLMPNLIMTTGIEATHSLSVINSKKLDLSFISGLDLRSQPSSHNNIQRPRQTKGVEDSSEGYLVLIVLEGLLKVLPLVSLVLDYARRTFSVKFCIRAHPVFPLEEIMSLLGKEIRDYPNLIPSESSLQDDFNRCSIAIYQGSTAFITGAKQQVPLLRFESDSYPSDDPFFLSSQPIHQFKDIDELDDLMHQFIQNKLYSESELGAIAAYASRYMSDPLHEKVDALTLEILSRLDL